MFYLFWFVLVFFLRIRRPPRSTRTDTLFPYTTLCRSTFANIRLRNQLAPGTEGGFTRDFTKTDAPVSSIYDASVNYLKARIPLVILTGKEYGSGSSRDWAAKGTALLGVRAVRSEEHTSELQSLMRISYAVFCLKKNKQLKSENT